MTLAQPPTAEDPTVRGLLVLHWWPKYKPSADWCVSTLTMIGSLLHVSLLRLEILVLLCLKRFALLPRGRFDFTKLPGDMSNQHYAPSRGFTYGTHSRVSIRMSSHAFAPEFRHVLGEIL